MLVHFTHSSLGLPFLIHQHHIFILYSTEYMMQESSHKTLALLTRMHLLSKKVSLIFMGVDIACSPFIPIIALLYYVIGDTLTLLLQSRVGDTGICQDWPVFTKDIFRTLHWDTHHPEFALESSEVFATLLHRNEFNTKQRALYNILILWKPVHRRKI